jgi:ribosome-binding protein aMBF1 (putative translation factor)
MPTRQVENTNQDWTPVVFSKSTTQNRTVNAEQQRNMSKQTAEQAKVKRLDAATEPEKIAQLPRNISVQLVAARVAKKISQKNLATQMNIPIKTIQDIENHRYKNDMQLAQRIARNLGITLTKK